MRVKNLSKLLKTSIRFKKLCKSPEEYIQKIHLSISHLNCGKPKKNIVKATNRGKKRHLTFNRTTTAGLWNTRKQQNDLKELRENNCSPRSYGQQKYPLISEGKVKTFSDRQKQKNY